MLRIVFRAVGWLLIALALAVFCYDMIKWVIQDSFELTDTGLLWRSIHPTSLQLAEAVISRYVHPFLWHPVIVTVLLTPAFIVVGLPGLILVAATRSRQRKPSSHLFMG